MLPQIDESTNALERIKRRAQETAHDLADVANDKHSMLDVTVQFIGATDLPVMDVTGRSDPYFVATIDNKMKLTSAVCPATLAPAWNELWHVKNVPSNGELKVTVYDKDSNSLKDGYIGTFVLDLTDGVKDAKIEGPYKRINGTFWTKITTSPASSPHLLPYTFDGPVSYSRHFSPTVGLLTHLDDNGKRLYSTWKIHIKGIQTFLPGPLQHWNTKYSAAQHIFGSGPSCLALRTTIQVGHRMLYARSTRNGFGTINSPADVISLLTGGRASPHRVKPAVYTYIISAEDDMLRFSETGAAFFVDFASKHALHANCAEYVRYSGEFHPRPEGGWAAFDENTTSDKDVKWELVIDNNSGTYAPDKTLLPKVKELIEHNFPGLRVCALDREDPALTESREACREFALKYRAAKKKELQPHPHQEGEETLSHRASIKRIPPRQKSPADVPPAEQPLPDAATIQTEE